VGLTNWWKFDDSIVDTVTGISLTASVTSVFTADRLGAARSAIYMTGSRSLTAPSGVYFSGDLSVTSWVFMDGYTNQARLITFQTGTNVNTVTFVLSHYTTGKPSMYISNSNGASSTELESSAQLPLRAWAHLAFTLKSNVGTMYIDAVSVGTKTYIAVPSVTRTANTIGKSPYTGESTDVCIDNLMFFNTGLTASQVLTLKNSY